eukprot:Skav218034  [mRNA]  locus=scaffold214:553425:554522:+ [translate_table: standard]
MPGVQEVADSLFKSDYQLQRAIPAPDDLPFHLQHCLATMADSDQGLAGTPQAIEIYTDGSCTRVSKDQPKTAAWAFVVVYRFAQGPPYLFGWDAAPVAPSGHEHALSSNLAKTETLPLDSFTGENEAIYRALVWCFSHPNIHAGIPVHIVSDAQTLVRAVEGAWQIAQRPFVEQVLQPLATAIQEIVELNFHWQRGHVGCVFNELADHLAYHFFATEAKYEPKAPALNESQVQQLPWVWMRMAAQFRSPGFGFRNGCLEFCEPPPITGSDQECWPHCETSPSETLWLDFTISTYNTNTLKGWIPSQAHGERWTTCAAVRQEQAKYQHIVALQETRAKSSKEWHTREWFGFASAACRGQGGTELWF